MNFSLRYNKVMNSGLERVPGSKFSESHRYYPPSTSGVVCEIPGSRQHVKFKHSRSPTSTLPANFQILTPDWLRIVARRKSDTRHMGINREGSVKCRTFRKTYVMVVSIDCHHFCPNEIFIHISLLCLSRHLLMGMQQNDKYKIKDTRHSQTAMQCSVQTQYYKLNNSVIERYRDGGNNRCPLPLC